MRGKATLVRFADDFVMTFETYYDAKRVMDVLGKRLGRFALHPDKRTSSTSVRNLRWPR